jgi:hypothetical protein
MDPETKTGREIKILNRGNLTLIQTDLASIKLNIK